MSNQTSLVLAIFAVLLALAVAEERRLSVNVAQGRAAYCTASSEHSASVYQCHDAFDGDLSEGSSTAWATAGECGGAWIEIDFGRRMRIDSFMYRSRYGSASDIAKNFRVIFDDTSSEQFQAPSSGDAAVYTLSVPKETQTARLELIDFWNGPCSNGGATEIEYYGFQALFPGLMDFSTGKSSPQCRASSQHGGVYTCGNAFDGQYADGSCCAWATQGTCGGSWIEVDFDEEVVITDIKYKQRNAGCDHARDVTISNTNSQSVSLVVADNTETQEITLPSPLTASTARFTIDSMYSGCCNPGASELVYLGNYTTTVYGNAALNRPCTASSSIGNPTYHCQRAFDGLYSDNGNEAWATNQQCAGAWTTVTFPTLYVIDSWTLRQRSSSSDFVKSARLYFDDGTSELFDNLVQSVAPQSYDFTPHLTSSVRFEVVETYANPCSNAGAIELEYYGKAFGDVEFPSAVTNLQATALSDAEVQLSWDFDDQSGDNGLLSSFEVEISGSESGLRTMSLDPSARSALILGFLPVETVSIEIVPQTPATEGAAASVNTTTTPGHPSPPSLVQDTLHISTSSVILVATMGDDNGSPITSVEFRLAFDSSMRFHMNIVVDGLNLTTGSSINVTFENLLPSTKHYASARATNAYGGSFFSPVLTDVVTATPVASNPLGDLVEATASTLRVQTSSTVDSPDARDVLHGAQCTASSELTGFDCGGANDDNATDAAGAAWASNGEGVGAWISFTFTRYYEVTALVVRQRSTGRVQSVRVYYDNFDYDYEDVSLQDTGDEQTLQLSPDFHIGSVRIEITAVFSQDNCGFAELDLLGHPAIMSGPHSNVAVGRPCTASSENSGGWVCEGAFDGDYTHASSSSWATQGEGTGSWIEVTLSREFVIDRFVYQQRTHPEDKNRVVDLTFYTNSGSSVQTFELGENNNVQLYFVEPVLANRIRLTVVSEYDHINNGAREIEYWGWEVDDSTTTVEQRLSGTTEWLPATLSGDVNFPILGGTVTVEGLQSAQLYEFRVQHYHSHTDQTTLFSNSSGPYETVDVIPPVLTLVGDSTVFINSGQAYYDEGATSVDGRDGDLTSSIVATPIGFNFSTPLLLEGALVVNYVSVDFSGNVAEVNRTVVVTDVDECTTATHNCDSNAGCTNYVGGFSCRCHTLFAGDGVTCEVPPVQSGSDFLGGILLGSHRHCDNENTGALRVVNDQVELCIGGPQPSAAWTAIGGEFAAEMQALQQENERLRQRLDAVEQFLQANFGNFQPGR